jgi:hypothetical protein
MESLNQKAELDVLKLPYDVPPPLRPENATTMFPDITADSINVLFENGYIATGVVTVVITPENKALILKHVGTAKVPEGAPGFLSETSKGAFAEDGHVVGVESVQETISRGLMEELGLTSEQVQSLNLKTKPQGAWQLIPWPIKDKMALGFVVVLHADDNAVRTISDQLSKIESEGGTEEVRGGDFFNWRSVGRNEEGVRDDGFWRNAPLITRAAHAVERNSSEFVPVQLPVNKASFTDDLKSRVSAIQ